MASITDPRVRAFLTEGTRTGKVSFVNGAGQPLVAPVWFVLDGDTIVFTTEAVSAKGRALARDRRLALCVDLQEPPYAFVQVQGEAALSEDLDELVRAATAIGTRYMGSERGAEFGARNGVPGELLVRLHPTRVVANFDVTA